MKKFKKVMAIALSFSMLVSSNSMSFVLANDVHSNTDAIETTITEENEIDIEDASETLVEDNTTKKDVTTETSEENINKEDTKKNITETLSTFDSSYDNVSTDGLDFSSKELLIATEDNSIFTSDTEVVSEYNGVYLTRYNTMECTKNAYMYYYNKADLVEINLAVKANSNSTDTDADTNADLSNINNGDDSFSIINDINVNNYFGYIALIDTGADYNNVKKQVSVIGDAANDDNGHGTSMAKSIYKANKDAKILSIKALDSNAIGNIQDVYTAIEYAIESNVSVINLSLSSITVRDSELLESAINEATNKGIIVVVSAGNNNKNAKYYTPANVSSAYTIGACDSNGIKIDSSNYGNTVDYWVVADNTSTSAAIFSAYALKGINYAINQSDVFTEIKNSNIDTATPTIDDIKNDNFNEVVANAGGYSWSDVDYTFIDDLYYRSGVNAHEPVLKYTYKHGDRTLIDNNGYPTTFTASIEIEQTSTSSQGYAGRISRIISTSLNPNTWNVWGSEFAAVGCHSHLRGDTGIPAPGNKGDRYTISNATFTWVGRDTTGDGQTGTAWELYYVSSKVDNKPNAQSLITILAIRKEAQSPYYYGVGITKKDSETSAAVSGCTFDVYNSSKTTKLGTMTAGANGTYTWKSGATTTDYGDQCYILETSASGKYNHSGNTNKWYGPYSLNRTKSGPVTPATNSNVITNIPLHKKIGVSKIDGNTGQAISGVTFDIYINGTAANKNGTFLKSITTNNDGKATLDIGYETVSAYAIETSVPSGCILDSMPFDLIINTSTGTAVSTYTTKKDAHEVYLTIKKSSENTDCVKNNPNYDLTGATYKVFTKIEDAQEALDNLDYTKAIMTFTCDKNGNTDIQKIDNSYLNIVDGAVQPISFYVVESQAGAKGYLRTNKVLRCDITIDKLYSSTSPFVFNVTDTPIEDPIKLSIEKVDAIFGTVESLAGTEFTVNFYPESIETIRNFTWLKNNSIPTITDTIIVDEQGKCTLNRQYPRGYITIEETKLPEGYTMDNDFKVYLNEEKDITNNLVFITDGILKDNDTDYNITTWYPGEAETYNDLTETVDSVNVKIDVVNPTYTRADIKLTKVDETTNEPMSHVKFSITNEDTKEKHYIYTDENGNATTKVTSYGNHVNYYDDVNDYDNTDDATVWFGQFEDKIIDAKDGYGALLAGIYTIKEERCEANQGRQLEPAHTIVITDNDKNTVIDIYDVNATEADSILYNAVNPSIKTLAIVKETSVAADEDAGIEAKNSHTLVQAGSKDIDWTNQTIIDTIEFNKLRFNTTYTVLSEVMVVTKDGSVVPYIDNDGNPYKRIMSFTTANEYKKSRYEINTTKVMELNGIDSTKLEENQDKLVVYESLYYGEYSTIEDLEEAIENNTIVTRYEEYDENDDMDIFPVEHKDANDTFQTVYPGDIHTTIADSVSLDRVAHTSGTTKLIDKIYYTGLTVGEKYTVEGTLQAKEGTDWSHIKYDPDNPDADEDGYVYTKEEGAEDDTVNKAYTFRDANGNPITAIKDFIPEEPDGYVELEFEFDSSLLDGKCIVAFEELRYNNLLIAAHKDLHDEDETVHYPEFKTTSWNSNITVEIIEDAKDSSKEVAAVAEGSSFTDTIHYHNLLANRKYIARGVLMDVKTGEELKDAKGNVIKGETIFTTSTIDAINITDTPDANDVLDESGIKILDMSSDHANYLCDGDVDVVFTGYDLTSVANKTGVVFEEIYLLSSDYDDKGIEITTETSVGEHKDLDDIEQFVYFIDMHTKAVDSLTKDQIVAENTDTSIIDTVTYENVIPGKKYSLVATLKVVGDTTGKYKDGDTLLDENGNTVTAEIEFIPTEKNGTVDVVIPFNSSILIKGTDIVVFEDMYNGFGIKVAAHTDLTDKDQTVHTPNGHTTALGEESKDHTIAADKEMTIIDTIYYENLIPGKEYTATGTIYRTDTKKPLEKNGKIITSTVKFTPKEKDGTVEVPITVDTSDLATKKLVLFEDVTYEDVTIFTHHDIEDEDQTVTVNMILGISIAKADKDDVKYFLKGAEITIYNQDGTVAKDINGKDCVGVTDANGNVKFEVLYQENNTYYAQETKAPNGYNINPEKFKIEATGKKDAETHNDIIKITILDEAIIIPPKTGDILLIMFSIIGILGISGIAIYSIRKRRILTK